MLFLPQYSPDLNPIEMAYSKLKAHLRKVMQDIRNLIGFRHDRSRMRRTGQDYLASTGGTSPLAKAHISCYRQTRSVLGENRP
jgi:hypothetical protein